MTTLSLAEALRAAPAAPTATAALELMRAAGLPLFAAAALFTLWSVAAPITGAVVAPAEVRVEGLRKPVQHAEGGIVRELLVHEGQTVRAGEPLLRLADLRTEAALKLLQDQRRALLARIARAEAEAAGAAQLKPPAELAEDAAAVEPLTRERALLTARRRALDEQLAQLGVQLRASGSQARALEAQIASTQAATKLSDEEHAMNERLAEQGYVNRSRLIGLQRISADYAARLAEHRGNLAAVQQRSAEIGARLAELRLNAQAQASEELREAAAQLRDVAERLTPSSDQAERLTVLAPVDGRVMSLRAAAPGTTVAARDVLMEIVPSQDKLVLDVRVAPQDVQQLRAGAAAEVKLLGSAWLRAAPLPARVAHIAPDRSSNPTTGQTWFAAVVEVDAQAVETIAAHGLPALHPGVPAEVYVTTGSRSLLGYLSAPLDLFTRRALREP